MNTDWPSVGEFLYVLQGCGMISELQMKTKTDCTFKVYALLFLDFTFTSLKSKQADYYVIKTTIKRHS